MFSQFLRQASGIHAHLALKLVELIGISQSQRHRQGDDGVDVRATLFAGKYSAIQLA